MNLHPDILTPIRPYLLYIKLGLAALALFGLGLLLWSWHVRGREIASLTEWQDAVIISVTTATLEPDKNGGRKTLKPAEIVNAIGVLRINLDRARSTLDQIDKDAKDAKSRSDASDAALRASLADAQQRYRTALDRIKGLESRKPAATPAEAAAAITEDSKAAWQGWTQ